MPDPENPGPKRKGRAGLIVVLLVICAAVAIFVGMNIQHAQELEEALPPGAAETN
jgi:hypothetical protein